MMCKQTASICEAVSIHDFSTLEQRVLAIDLCERQPEKASLE